jgi:glycine cleavage system H protein
MTRFYTKDHEWIEITGDEATIGITDYAQKQLGDVVFVELPEIGSAFKAGDDAAVVESVKAASEVYAPIDGVVTAINHDLDSNPDRINQEPESGAWFFKLKPSQLTQLDTLMNQASYNDYINGL